MVQREFSMWMFSSGSLDSVYSLHFWDGKQQQAQRWGCASGIIPRWGISTWIQELPEKTAFPSPWEKLRSRSQLGKWAPFPACSWEVQHEMGTEQGIPGNTHMPEIGGSVPEGFKDMTAGKELKVGCWMRDHDIPVGWVLGTLVGS